MTSRKKIVILVWKRKNKEPEDQWTRAIDHAVKKALRFPKVVITVLVVFMVATGWVAWQNHQTNIRQAQDSISSCETGNAFRAGQTAIWEKNYALQAQENKATAALLTQLIATLAGNDPAKIAEINSILAKSGKASTSETQQFLDYIKAKDVAHNCQQEFSNVSGNANPSVPTSSGAKDVSASSQIVHLQSWNGGCLSVSGTSVGSRVIEVACGSDHAWTYTSAGELYPQGHPNVAVGDSGGSFVLKAVPGTSLHTNSTKSGPSGYLYDQINFNASNTYWHASGDGKNVTFDNSSGNLANYWAFLTNGTATTSNASVV